MQKTAPGWPIVTAGFLVIAALAGCSSAASSQPPTAAPTSGEAAAKAFSRPTPTADTVPVEFTVELSSQYSKLTTAGPDDSVVYGYRQLDGYTKINDRSVRVRMQGLTDSSEGTGPIGGFLELSWSDGMTLGLRQQGTVTYDSAAKTTDLKADLTVIGGTDEAARTTGSGSYVGSRKSSSSSTIKLAITLALQHPPKAIGADSTPTPSASYSATIMP